MVFIQNSSINNISLFIIKSFNSILIGKATNNFTDRAKNRNNKRITNFSNFPVMPLSNLKSGSFLRRRNSDSAMLSVCPQPGDAQKWSESFATLMASKYGSALYRAFLLREFSNENLEFWLAVEEYKNSRPQKMAAKAQEIFEEFVAVQASKQINLDAETRLITLTNIQSNIPDQYAFDVAQRRTQYILENDSYLRFLQSRLFLELAHPERY